MYRGVVCGVAAVFAAALACSSPAHALSCSFSITNLNFGAVESTRR
jgi:hypothetical protein